MSVYTITLKVGYNLHVMLFNVVLTCEEYRKMKQICRHI